MKSNTPAEGDKDKAPPLTKPAYTEMMKSWMDSAKSCGQLATAAMFLPVFMTRDVYGLKQGAPLHPNINGWFLLTWALFIVAIVLAQTYQISATKLISTYGYRQPWLFPKVQYWLMIVTMVCGMLAFVSGSLNLFELPAGLTKRLNVQPGAG